MARSYWVIGLAASLISDIPPRFPLLERFLDLPPKIKFSRDLGFIKSTVFIDAAIVFSANKIRSEVKVFGPGPDCPVLYDQFLIYKATGI